MPSSLFRANEAIRAGLPTRKKYQTYEGTIMHSLRSIFSLFPAKFGPSSGICLCMISFESIAKACQTFKCNTLPDDQRRMPPYQQATSPFTNNFTFSIE
jgi:hypothetical protein